MCPQCIEGDMSECISLGLASVIQALLGQHAAMLLGVNVMGGKT